MPAAREPLWMRVSPWIAALYGLGVVAMLARLSLGVEPEPAGSHGNGPVVRAPSSTFSARWRPHGRCMPCPCLVRMDEIVTPKSWASSGRGFCPGRGPVRFDPAQLEMILIHEFAHVRRHDMWVNLLQRLAEAVFFFNPAVWYLSRRISTFANSAVTRDVPHTGDGVGAIQN